MTIECNLYLIKYDLLTWRAYTVISDGPGGKGGKLQFSSKEVNFAFLLVSSLCSSGCSKVCKTMSSNIIWNGWLYSCVLTLIHYSQKNVFSRRRSFQIFGNHRLALPHPVHFALSHDDDDPKFETSVHMIIEVNSAPETRCGVQNF